ncbi:MAG: DUF1648 domain-containing protein [Ezakiella sp.]|nr:DUF1648 domain-containing protein [Ezakiella sp.]
MKKSTAILILSILVGVLAIMTITDKVPMHFDSNGEITRYGSRYELLIFPAIIFVLILFWEILARVTSKGVASGKSENELQKAEINANMIRFVGAVTCFGVLATQIMVYLIAKLSMSTDYIKIGAGVVIGLILIGAGYATKNTHINKAIGVRIKKTFESEEIWRKVNKKTGITLMIIGFLVAVAAFTKIDFKIVMITAILIIVVSTFVYTAMETSR